MTVSVQPWVSEERVRTLPLKWEKTTSRLGFNYHWGFHTAVIQITHQSFQYAESTGYLSHKASHFFNTNTISESLKRDKLEKFLLGAKPLPPLCMNATCINLNILQCSEIGLLYQWRGSNTDIQQYGSDIACTLGHLQVRKLCTPLVFLLIALKAWYEL